tara:strand:- start:734 stop:1360 length:627 start_codon:yes stop_codon:yes gene_type:complete
MNILQGFTAFLVGYLAGCFQTSYFISNWILKKDIRDIGSGNAGASNITSELGWKYGVLTAFADIFKAYLPTQIITFIFPGAYQPLDLIVLAGTGAILGHIYPFFLDFRGGKGIACYIGMLLAIDWKMGLVVILLLIVITLLTDYISVGSIALYIIIAVLSYYFSYSNIIITCSIILFIVGIIKHWINIKRIMNGSEIGLRSVYKKYKK